MRAGEIAVLGLLGAVLFAGKIALAGLPNIEIVSLLVIVYTVVLGWRALFPVYVYVWPALVLAARLLWRMESPLGWAVLSGAFGMSFGALCALVYLVSGGWAFALSWWIQGIPFDLLHCAGNFVLALTLFRPCKKLLTRLTGVSLRGKGRP